MTRISGFAGEILGDQVVGYTSGQKYEGRAVNTDYDLEGITLETDEGFRWFEPDALNHKESVIYLEKTSLSRVVPNRFSVGEYPEKYVKPTAEKILESKGQKFVPTVQKMPEGYYEVVDGHRTLYAIHEAGGFDDIWVRVLDPFRSGLEVFADDHLQLPSEERSDFQEERIPESLEKMLECYPEDYLRRFETIDSALDRLNR